MNLTPRRVGFPRSAGHDATHWSSVGSGSASDRTICDCARQAHARQTAPSVVLLRGESLVGGSPRAADLMVVAADPAPAWLAVSALLLGYTAVSARTAEISYGE
jgi:hypothetical protein